MGSKTERKKAKIAQGLEGRELIPEQHAVVDVFTGKSNNQPLEALRADGRRRVIMRKGKKEEEGTSYSLLNHYGTSRGVFTSDNILVIMEVIEKGIINQKNRRGVPVFE